MDETESKLNNNLNNISETEIKKQSIPPAVADLDEQWVRDYIEQFGNPPSFF